jgi:hypothetical protein
MNHRYVSRPERESKPGSRILHSITKRGIEYYEKIRNIAGIQRVASELGDWRISADDESAAAAFIELFVSLYRLTDARFHKARDIKIYDAFISRVEMAIQNYLNENLAKEDRGKMDGPLRSLYKEFYMARIPRASVALREDGKLAYQSGHGLTQCHVDLLCDQLKLYEKETLLSHNEKWLERKKGLDVDEELQKEFAERRSKLEEKYPAAYGTEIGLNHLGKRGRTLALANSEKSLEFMRG